MKKNIKYFDILGSFALLEYNDIPCIETFIIDNKKQLKNKKQFPYVMKLCSKQLLHKTEHKAVYLNLYSLKDLERAFNELNLLINKYKLKKGAIILQKQIKGPELIIGIKEDKSFGKTIMFGTGGIYTEVFKDKAIKLIPLTNKDINDLISQTKIGNIFKNKKVARGETYSLASLKKLIKDISNFAIKNDIKELDLNPVIVTPNGLEIVDARIGILE
jgi:succinyl-CoA synthetase beta subunit